VAIGSGVLLPGVAENPTFPILRALAYTTGLGYRPTCDSVFSVVLRRVLRTVNKAYLRTVRVCLQNVTDVYHNRVEKERRLRRHVQKCR